MPAHVVGFHGQNALPIALKDSFSPPCAWVRACRAVPSSSTALFRSLACTQPRKPQLHSE